MPTITLDKMVHGGKAMGRDPDGRVLFVLGGLPGERVRVAVDKPGTRATDALLKEVLKRSPDRVDGRCTEPTQCTFQHIRYDAQLRLKEEIVRDQMAQMGLEDVRVRPIIPSTTPWQYRIETILSPTKQGGLGYWSPQEKRVIPAVACHALHPALTAIVPQIDLTLPGLRKLTVRVGADEHLLLVFAIDEAEAPEIVLDIPVSAAIVMPDGVAASLLGDPYLVQRVKERHFRVSPGCFFHPNVAGATQLVDTVLDLAKLEGNEKVVEACSGVGMLTAFLAQEAAELHAIEKNAAAIDDAIANLHDADNVSLYEDWAEEALWALLPDADLLVLDTDQKGITEDMGNAILAYLPPKIIYSNGEIGKMAEDAAELAAAGYRLAALQPIDMLPQTHHIHTVTVWTHSKN